MNDLCGKSILNRDEPSLDSEQSIDNKSDSRKV